MKSKLVIILVVIAGTLFYLLSCSKEEQPNLKNQSGTPQLEIFNSDGNSIDNLINYYFEDYLRKTNQTKGPINNIWKWIKAHAGVWMFGNCGFDLPCGPCPGICVFRDSNGNVFIPVSDDYRLSDEQYDNGERLIQLALFNDSIMGLSIIHDHIVYNDSIYIFEDFSIGPDASSLFQKDSIVIMQGAYPVSYSHSRNGTTILNVISY